MWARYLALMVLTLPFVANSWGAVLERHIVAPLNGDWHFKADPQNVGETEGWYQPGKIRDRTIVVPSSWEVIFGDLRTYNHSAWYERNFLVPANVKGRRIAAVFMGVNWSAKVWVNGRLAGEHENGYTPFTVDLSGFVKFGKQNTITVKATNFDDDSLLPYDSEMAFVRMGGIWRDAWVEESGRTYVSDIHVIPNIDVSTARVRAWVSSAGVKNRADLKLKVTITSPDGKAFSTVEPVSAESGEQPNVDSVISIQNPILWDVDHPNLYTLTGSVLDHGRAIDIASTHFGMRKIDTQGVYIRLNNNPIYLRGGLDFVDYPNRNLYLNPYHPWTDEEIKAEILRWKQMGFNFIRKYGIEDSRYMDWCDRLGMLIMDEAPFYNKLTDETQRRWDQMFRGLILRDRNHPSVIIWDLFNESGGFGGKIELLNKYYDLAKSLDPSRLVIDNSGGLMWIQDTNTQGNHPITDIDDMHYYNGEGPEWYPRSRDYLQSMMAHGKPLMFTEMLALTFLPDMDKIRQGNGGQVPWWFFLPYIPGSNKENKNLSSVGYEEAFHEWKLDRIFGDFSGFVKAHDWRDFSVLKYELEQTRKSPDMGGYVWTQMNQQPGQGPVGILGDFGFGDPWVFAPEMAMVNSPDLVFVDWSKVNFWTGDTFRADVIFSHFSSKPITDAVLKWSVNDLNLRGEIRGVSAEQVGVQRIGQIAFSVPGLKQSVKAKLEISLEKGNETLSKNYMYFQVVPKEYIKTAEKQPINVYMPEKRALGDDLLMASARLSFAGYQVHSGLDPKVPVAIATAFDDKTDEYLAKGGTVLLFPSDLHQVKQRLGLTIGENVYYAGQAGWPVFIDKSFGLFSRIPYENPIAWPFYLVYSRNAIAGLTPDSIPDIIAAGYGPWFLHTQIPSGDSGSKVTEGAVNPCIAQFKYKNGRIVLTTFRVLENFVEDPVATVMLHDLIGYVSTPFQPRMSLPLKPAEGD
jgi:hypothetical protein